MTINIRRIPAPNTLIIFESSARHLSFTRAAAELAMTPAAVSKQVQQLEARLHVRLFIRGARSLTLTPRGAQLYAAVFSALGQVADAVAQVRLPDSDIVSVSATSAFANCWLLPRLGTLAALHPDVTLRVITSELNQGPLPQGADLSVRYCTSQAAPGASLLFSVAVAPLCSPSFSTRHGIRALDDLERVPLLELTTDHWQSLDWDSWLSQAGGNGLRTRIGHYANDYVMLQQAAERGVGVFLGWDRLASDAIAAGRLVAPLRERVKSPPGWGYHLMAGDPDTANPAVRKVQVWLEAEAASGG